PPSTTSASTSRTTHPPGVVNRTASSRSSGARRFSSALCRNSIAQSRSRAAAGFAEPVRATSGCTPPSRNSPTLDSARGSRAVPVPVVVVHARLDARHVRHDRVQLQLVQAAAAGVRAVAQLLAAVVRRATGTGGAVQELTQLLPRQRVLRVVRADRPAGLQRL